MRTRKRAKIISRLAKVEIDGGFVQLLDVMGTDSDVVAAARTSYGEGTRTVRDDRALIRYMMRHQHHSPFEMCEMKFLLEVPMDTWRQFVRHRTANINEYSTRYSVAIGKQATVSPGRWRLQSQSNKQGSEDIIDDEDLQRSLSQDQLILHAQAGEIYQQRLSLGVAREQARMDLPLSTYTRAVWKLDLRNLLHFLNLRMDKHAQQEIRAYANVIASFVRSYFPLTWEAFEDYVLDSVTLSKHSLKALSLAICLDNKETLQEYLDTFMSKREQSDFKAFLREHFPGVARF